MHSARRQQRCAVWQPLSAGPDAQWWWGWWWWGGAARQRFAPRMSREVAGCRGFRGMQAAAAGEVFWLLARPCCAQECGCGAAAAAGRADVQALFRALHCPTHPACAAAAACSRGFPALRLAVPLVDERAPAVGHVAALGGHGCACSQARRTVQRRTGASRPSLQGGTQVRQGPRSMHAAEERAPCLAHRPESAWAAARRHTWRCACSARPEELRAADSRPEDGRRAALPAVAAHPTQPDTPAVRPGQQVR